MGSTWFTTLDAIRRGEPDWQAIACYREPIARFLDRVHPRLARDVRDDVVQEVLCAMRTRVLDRFDPDRGRFHDYLRGVIRNQVLYCFSDRLLPDGGLGLATRPRLRVKAYPLRALLAGERPDPVARAPVEPGATRDALGLAAEEPR